MQDLTTDDEKQNYFLSGMRTMKNIGNPSKQPCQCLFIAYCPYGRTLFDSLE
jgi:hypothetical protein